VRQTQDEIELIAHFAKANPHWKKLSPSVIVSFQGPQRYISPSIYVKKDNVPTWNYAVVQIQGTPEIVSDQNGIKDILNESVQFFEAQNKTDWKYDLPTSFIEKLESAIVGLRIKVKKIDAKFKLSQNRDSEDYEAVSHFLKASESPKDQELLKWMLRSAH